MFANVCSHLNKCNAIESRYSDSDALVYMFYAAVYKINGLYTVCAGNCPLIDKTPNISIIERNANCNFFFFLDNFSKMIREKRQLYF